MSQNKTITVAIKATDGASQTFLAVGRNAQTAAVAIEGTGTSSRSAAADFERLAQRATAAGAAIGTVVGVVSRLGASAQDQRRQIQGIEQAYGAAASQVEAFAKQVQSATIFSDDQARQAALRASTLQRNYQIETQQIQELIKVGADLATLYGIDLDQATERLTSAIRGEAEAAEYLGITLNDTFVATKAAERGIEGWTTTMTEAEKAQFRFQLLLEQTTYAQGAAGREAETAAGQAARLGNELQNLSANAGGVLGPIGGLTAGLSDIAILAPAAGAAIGKLTAETGGLAKGVGAGSAGFTSLVTSITPATAAIGGATLAIGLLTAAFIQNKKNAEETAAALAGVQEAAGQIADTTARGLVLMAQLTPDELAAAYANFDEAFLQLNNSMGAYTLEGSEVTRVNEEIARSASLAGDDIQQIAQDLNELSVMHTAGVLSGDDLIQVLTVLNDVLDYQGTNASAARAEFSGLIDELAHTQDADAVIPLMRDLATNIASVGVEAGVATPEVDALNRSVTDAYAAINQRGASQNVFTDLRDDAIAASIAANDAMQAVGLASGAGFGAGRGSQSRDEAVREAQEYGDARRKAADEAQRAEEDAQREFERITRERLSLTSQLENAEERRADAVERAAEIEQDAIERTRDIQRAYVQDQKAAEKDLSQGRRSLAGERVDIEREAAKEMRDLEQQRRDAAIETEEQLRDLAEQRADIQAGATRELADAERQYHDSIAETAREQRELRADMATARREAAADFQDAARENARSLRELREELKDTLSDARLDRSRDIEDNELAAKRAVEDANNAMASLGLQNLSPEERAQREREIQQNLARELEDLSTERNRLQEDFEIDRQQAREEAREQEKALERDRRQAQQDYHTEVRGLEKDTSDRIKDLQKDQNDAAKVFASEQKDIKDRAAQDLQDLSGQYATVLDDQKTKFGDIEADKRLIVRDSAIEQRLLARETAQLEAGYRRDLAAVERGYQRDLQDAAIVSQKAARDAQEAIGDVDADIAEIRGELSELDGTAVAVTADTSQLSANVSKAVLTADGELKDWAATAYVAQLDVERSATFTQDKIEIRNELLNQFANAPITQDIRVAKDDQWDQMFGILKREIEADIKSIQSTVKVTMVYQQPQISNTAVSAGTPQGGGNPRTNRASGGRGDGQYAMVGELGPEMVWLPNGSYVLNAGSTQGRLDAWGVQGLAGGGVQSEAGGNAQWRKWLKKQDTELQRWLTQVAGLTHSDKQGLMNGSLVVVGNGPNNWRVVAAGGGGGGGGQSTGPSGEPIGTQGPPPTPPPVKPPPPAPSLIPAPPPPPTGEVGVTPLPEGVLAGDIPLFGANQQQAALVAQAALNPASLFASASAGGAPISPVGAGGSDPIGRLAGVISRLERSIVRLEQRLSEIEQASSQGLNNYGTLYLQNGPDPGALESAARASATALRV